MFRFVGMTKIRISKLQVQITNRCKSANEYNVVIRNPDNYRDVSFRYLYHFVLVGRAHRSGGQAIRCNLWRLSVRVAEGVSRTRQRISASILRAKFIRVPKTILAVGKDSVKGEFKFFLLVNNYLLPFYNKWLKRIFCKFS